MQLGIRAFPVHLKNVDGVPGVVGVRVLAHGAQVHRLHQHRGGRVERGHVELHRPQPADLALGGNGAALPWVRLPHPTVVDQRKALALGVFEIERHAPVALGHRALRHPTFAQPLGPVLEGPCPTHAQARAGDRVRAAPLGLHRPVEKGQVGAGRALGIGVEQVIGAHIVLVDAALHQPHAQHLGVEVVVVADLRGDRGEMVDTGKFEHIFLPL